MHHSRLALVVGMLALCVGIPGGAAAQQQDQPDWELTGLSGPVLQLFTPTSGAFLARTPTGLMRSDDGGDTWRPELLPPGPTGVIAVDPTNHATVYAVGSAGLSLSIDDARTWQVILPATTRVPVTCEATEPSSLCTLYHKFAPDGVLVSPITHVAVSPADPNLLYVSFATQTSPGHTYGLLRSQDQGRTWQPLEAVSTQAACGFGFPFVSPHPSDPSRVFRSFVCYGGGAGDAGPTAQSRDRGQTWIDSGLPQQPADQSSVAIVGGQGPNPATFFLAIRWRGSRAGELLRNTAQFLRSDDDGATWAQVSSFAPGDAEQSAAFAGDSRDTERLYSGVALAESPTGVKTSADGGITWSELGRQDTGTVNDIAVGIDGQNLYAATDTGVWRLHRGS